MPGSLKHVCLFYRFSGRFHFRTGIGRFHLSGRHCHRNDASQRSARFKFQRHQIHRGLGRAVEELPKYQHRRCGARIFLHYYIIRAKGQYLFRFSFVINSYKFLEAVSVDFSKVLLIVSTKNDPKIT